MRTKISNSVEWFERLAQLYDLMPSEQDVGIVNADGNRLDEYLEIFLNHEVEDIWEWEELADLVLESANDVILDGNLTEGQEQKLVNIVVEHKEKFPNQFEYWMNFSNDKDYPIKKIVRLGNF